MKKYNPMKRPPPDQWLKLEEAQQIELVAAHHRGIKVKTPRPEVHAMVHVVVEDQLAEGIKPVQDALKRLMADGLDRHDAIHAMGTVLMDHFQRIARGESTGPDSHEQYFRDLKELTAEKWLKNGDKG
jgi:hypothetical protein